MYNVDTEMIVHLAEINEHAGGGGGDEGTVQMVCRSGLVDWICDGLDRDPCYRVFSQEIMSGRRCSVAR